MNVVFCLPGKNFSNNFLRSWTLTLNSLYQRGINVELVNNYSSNVYYVRNMCLGGDNLKGQYQRPWQGKLNYDYIFWIDSDIVWKPYQVMRLIAISERYSEVKIVSGLYLMENQTEFATVLNWDLNYFKINGRFEFLTKNKLKMFNPDRLIEVAYTGFGFIVIKKGVFEKIGYPWFRPVWEEIETSNQVIIKDFTSEDVGFCRTAINKGFKIYVDPTLIVGHEKTKVLY